MQERIFERDGVLRWRGSDTLGYCKIGVPLGLVLQCLSPRTEVTGSVRNPEVGLSKLWDLYRDEEYLLWFDSSKKKALIVLKDNASPTSQLKAWAQALSVARAHRRQSRGEQKSSTAEDTLTILKNTLAGLTEAYESHLRGLKLAGWDVDTAALETSSGRRVEEQ